MIVLVSGASVTHRVFAHTGRLGHLLTPRNGSAVAPIVGSGLAWAADNDCFKALDAHAYRRMLRKIAKQPGCRFVAVPDVVADAGRTLELFDQWADEVSATGQPLALVGQNGMEDRELPWDRFGAFFVGGSTDWKLGACAADLIREARRRGKWVHMGRCQTKRRLGIAYHAGCDSVDGSSMSRWPDRFFPLAMRWLEQIERIPPQGWHGRRRQLTMLEDDADGD